MPIPSEFELTFGCGHVGSIDLSTLPPDRRAGRLAYLKDKGMCGDCFEQTRTKRREVDLTKWITAGRKEEAAEAAQWERQEHFPRLTGTAKQTGYGARVRFELMRELYRWSEAGHAPADYDQAEATARTIDSASWWLDQKSLITDPTDLVELLAATAASRDGQVCENPA